MHYNDILGALLSLRIYITVENIFFLLSCSVLFLTLAGETTKSSSELRSHFVVPFIRIHPPTT